MITTTSAADDSVSDSLCLIAGAAEEVVSEWVEFVVEVVSGTLVAAVTFAVDGRVSGATAEVGDIEVDVDVVVVVDVIVVAAVVVFVVVFWIVVVVDVDVVGYGSGGLHK